MRTCIILTCFEIKKALSVVVPVRPFINRSQRMSKCGRNKNVAQEAIAECVTFVLTTFWRHL